MTVRNTVGRKKRKREDGVTRILDIRETGPRGKNKLSDARSSRAIEKVPFLLVSKKNQHEGKCGVEGGGKE